MRPRLALSLVLAALLGGACGSGGDEERRAAPGPPPEATPRSSPAERAITGWSDALRRSDVDRAMSYFSLPLVISQGRAVRLQARSQLRLFNSSLPCGSRVTGVTRREDYFVATFRLTERPGKRCDAPGSTARVAFKLRGDRIREWRQLLERAPEQALPPDAEAS